MKDFDQKYRSRLEKMSTTNIADALDALSLKGSTYGIIPMWHSMGKIIGPAVTIKVIASGLTKGKHHLGVNAISVANPGDVIIIDNGGRIDTSCWGGILSNGAKMKGVSGVVIDGACRDLDESIETGFNVYARGTVVATARGRVTEEATNVMIQVAGVQVRPGDIVMGDRSGVVIIPKERLDEVVLKAEELHRKETAMIKEILSGVSILEVDTKYNYESMLKK